jgi:hypothetical protein
MSVDLAKLEQHLTTRSYVEGFVLLSFSPCYFLLSVMNLALVRVS